MTSIERDHATPTPDATVRFAAAPARTDVPAVPAPRGPRHAGPEPVGGPPPTGSTTTPGAVRAVGGALSVFGAGWAGGMLLLGEESAASVLGAASAVAFQCSLIALCWLVWRTAATGTRRAGRVLVGIEMGVLALATVQSASEVVPGVIGDTLALVLDPFWPLSMLGMMIVGITVACAGRWRGAARVWTPVATSWIALLPTMAFLPMSAVGYLMTGHILLGYVVLGGILAVRPDLTRR